MAEFAYNNAKNASIGHMLLKLNCGFYLQVFFKDDIKLCSGARFANKLAKEIKEPIDICQQNLLHAQKLEEKAYDQGVMTRSYAPGEKVWLNSKYINTKQNRKLKTKFFGLFQILYPVRKQAYKWDLLTK